MLRDVWLVLLGGTLMACSGEAPPAGPAPESVQIPNPASAYCIEQGGRLERVEGPNGTSGHCILPSGERIEEWTLFRRDRPGGED